MARSQVASDNFNRANGTLGSDWAQLNTNDGELEIISNAVHAPYSNMVYARWVGAGTFDDDQYAEVVMSGFASNNDRLGVAVRCSADTNATRDAYLFYVHDNGGTPAWRLDKVVNGTTTNLANSTAAFVATDLLSMEVEGTTIRVYRNSTQLGSDVTDSALATGKPGVCGYQSGGGLRLDDWTGGDITAGAPTAPGTPTFTLVTTTSATVTYTAGGAGTTQYQYRVNGGSWINNSTALTFDLSSLTPNTLYTIDVQAGNATPDWSASATDSFTTDSAGGTLKAGAMNLLINGQRLYI